MQARVFSVVSIDNLILTGSTLGAFLGWLAMSFLQSAAGIDFTILEKLTGAGGAAFLMFLILKWALRRNDEQAKRINDIHDKQQERLNAIYEERIKELKDALKEK